MGPFVTELYWVKEIEPLRLALMPRPRGADLLEGEVASWQSAGIGLVVSLLEPHEVSELDLRREASLCEIAQIKFISVPIADRGVPKNRAAIATRVNEVVSTLRRGAAVAVHCRAGIGRTAVFAGCVLHELGTPVAEIFPLLSRARRVQVPDTPEQVEWVHGFTRSVRSAL
jgi:protein-tyrosine phosphatase